MGFKAKIIVLLSIFLFVLRVEAQDTIVLFDDSYLRDDAKAVIICNQSVEDINNDYQNKKGGVLIDEKYFSFYNSIDSIRLGEGYKVSNTNTGKDYQLFFTQLPLVSITTGNKIEDDERVLAHFTLFVDGQKSVSQKIGIEYRGGWTQTLDKKSFRIEFWKDDNGDKTKNVKLLGMRKDDDWNLQALTNEPLRIRRKTGHQLWKQMHSIYYNDVEPEAVNGIKMEYVEVFLNNEFRGIYALGERIDRKQMKLVKYEDGIKGELYKGVDWDDPVLFKGLKDYDNSSDYWGGFEYKYPDKIDWKNLYNLVDFVVNTPNEKFYDDYKSNFEYDNIIDYFIFINIIRALDNIGKNIYFVRYKSEEPYFFAPWDLDGILGTNWRGNIDNTTNGLLSNGLYDRLWHDCSDTGFRRSLEERWTYLRQNILSKNNIMSLVESNFNYLKENGIYNRESIAWSDYDKNLTDIGYISNWLDKRLEYLDQKILESCYPVSDDTLSFKYIKFYPNPAYDFVNFYNFYNTIDEIKIFDSLGRFVSRFSAKEGENRVPVYNLANGQYYLYLTGKKGTKVVKVFVIK